jgi:acetyl/propionyl-CoA carboxylase alpha subunit
MGQVATTAARAADYRNAGTVEFLVDGRGEAARFYFLEMNTRLQVEHPVTEMVTGVDIVRAQLLIAGGQPLPWNQDALGQRGHAIECRVYGEDPEQDFLPAAGRLLAYREPTGPGLRVDSGVVEGSEVPVHYDPLIAKLIAYGETRPLAIGRARAALRRYIVLGVKTNISFLCRVLEHPRFQSGAIDTGFIDAERATLIDHHPNASVAAVAAAAVAVHMAQRGQRAETGRTRPPSPEPGVAQPLDPWNTLTQWPI